MYLTESCSLNRWAATKERLSSHLSSLQSEITTLVEPQSISLSTKEMEIARSERIQSRVQALQKEIDATLTLIQYINRNTSEQESLSGLSLLRFDLKSLKQSEENVIKVLSAAGARNDVLEDLELTEKSLQTLSREGDNDSVRQERERLRAIAFTLPLFEDSEMQGFKDYRMALQNHISRLQGQEQELMASLSFQFPASEELVGVCAEVGISLVLAPTAPAPSANPPEPSTPPKSESIPASSTGQEVNPSAAPKPKPAPAEHEKEEETEKPKAKEHEPHPDSPYPVPLGGHSEE